jgi:hypothetical protein
MYIITVKGIISEIILNITFLFRYVSSLCVYRVLLSTSEIFSIIFKNLLLLITCEDHSHNTAGIWRNYKQNEGSKYNLWNHFNTIGYKYLKRQSNAIYNQPYHSKHVVQVSIVSRYLLVTPVCYEIQVSSFCEFIRTDSNVDLSQMT